MDIVERIETFHTQLLIPLYQEISASSRMLSKGRAMSIERGSSSTDPVSSDGLAMIHDNRRAVASLPSTPEAGRSGEWIGATLVMVESAEQRAGFSHPQAGRFYLSALFRLPGDGRVLASPWVMYWMRFNDKMHAFAHRYDPQELADHPIETLTRKDLVNHALNAISGFDVYAFSESRPF